MEWHQELICPYCWNAQDSDYWQPGVGRSMPVGHKCEHCGKVFAVYTRVTTVFSTEKLKASGENE